ncbi:hypothetical protein [Streptomyces drozdowiczii]|uniref:Uncharacterized protein n=1 Tax=Streptomyces drozdowiczii TaxID=202862 RepID=A0ABY6Q1E2_9ACTN|nr:hypothetical protein [Streptomyces drozdowiczii]MCX0247982.1 hypothetical protein [Streptomyces drozdowiczii]UZK58243.1 hypothetical protein NEH16_32920 [Streptomyces drozdowiczii]
MTRTRSKSPLWEPGPIPLPGGLLDWRDPRHYDRRQDHPCTLCGTPTPLRSHTGEPAHKSCAEAWIAANPAEARTGRFASDSNTGRSRRDDHA